MLDVLSVICPGGPGSWVSIAWNVVMRAWGEQSHEGLMLEAMPLYPCPNQ